jgi:hypothetical protein
VRNRNRTPKVTNNPRGLQQQNQNHQQHGNDQNSEPAGSFKYFPKKSNKKIKKNTIINSGIEKD